jgi:Na+-driven multidrug efflux pump
LIALLILVITRSEQMLHGPLVPTLLRLATPNIVGLFAMTVVIGYDGYILGKVGADALTGIALVFSISMLMMQMSGSGIGGAVTAAVARALGAAKHKEASDLAVAHSEYRLLIPVHNIHA